MWLTKRGTYEVNEAVLPSPNEILTLNRENWACRLVSIAPMMTGTGSPGTTIGKNAFTNAVTGGATTVIETEPLAVWLLARSLYETASEALPVKPFVGVNCRPLRAALRLASVPCRVIEAEPFAPEVTVIPLVVAKLTVPLVTVSVSCSTLEPAFESATVMALPLPVEKTNDVFSASEAVAGALIDGGELRELIVNTTGRLLVGPVAELESLLVNAAR